MHILFFNPQGNFDPEDSHLTEHPDFGGQLVYVKEVAMAMADAGHSVQEKPGAACGGPPNSDDLCSPYEDQHFSRNDPAGRSRRGRMR